MVSTSCVQIIALVGEIRPLYQQEYPGEPETMELLQQYLYARIRNRLHIVLCMSPEHPRFAERLRKFPALVGCCNIDWFLPWPREALLAVSQGFLQPFQAEVSTGWLSRLPCHLATSCAREPTRLLPTSHSLHATIVATDCRLCLTLPLRCRVAGVCQVDEKDKAVAGNVIQAIASIHTSVLDLCGSYFASTRRRVTFTPRSFLGFIKYFHDLFKRKLELMKVQLDSQDSVVVQRAQCGHCRVLPAATSSTH